LLIAPSSSEDSFLILSCKNCSEPSPHKAIEGSQCVFGNILKVVAPTSQYWVQLCYHGLDRLPTDPTCLLPDSISELLYTFPSYPACSCLKSIAEKFKSFPFYHTIPKMGFLWMKSQFVFGDPRLHYFQCLFCFFLTLCQNYKIVCIS